MKRVFGEDTHKLSCAALKLDPETSEVFLMSMGAQCFDEGDLAELFDEVGLSSGAEILFEVEKKLYDVKLPDGFRMVGVSDKEGKEHYAVVDFSSIGYK